MTVAALAPIVSYTEDGVSLAFPVPFRFLAPTDLQATRTDPLGVTTALAYGSDYTVTGGGSAASGTLTLAATIMGSTLSIWRATPRVQPIDYATNDRFPAETHELGLDRDMLIEQEQDGELGRALVVPVPEDGFVLPPAADRAQGILGFDGDGNPIILPPSDFSDIVVLAHRQEVTASAGQTNFTTDVEYLPGYLGVFVNGVRLSVQEYTATDGLNVVLHQPLVANDIVLMEGFLGSATAMQGPPGPPGASGAQIVSVGDSPPPAPVVGQTWWESDSGNTFVYYDDGTSAQWVPAHVGAVRLDAPSDGKLYGRKNGQWVEIV